MIRAITLCINHSSKIRKLDLDRPRVTFEPGYNAIIGRNGAGKSTLLRAIATCSMCAVEKSGPVEEIKYITTELLNPHASGGLATREEMVRGIRAMFLSHGQGVLDGLRFQRHASEAVVLIDSPETGQDHANCQLIHAGLLRMAERRQVIVATNHLAFMRGGNIIDLGSETLVQLLADSASLLAEFDALL